MPFTKAWSFHKTVTLPLIHYWPIHLPFGYSRACCTHFGMGKYWNILNIIPEPSHFMNQYPDVSSVYLEISSWITTHGHKTAMHGRCLALRGRHNSGCDRTHFGIRLYGTLNNIKEKLRAMPLQISTAEICSTDLDGYSEQLSIVFTDWWSWVKLVQIKCILCPSATLYIPKHRVAALWAAITATGAVFLHRNSQPGDFFLQIVWTATAYDIITWKMI